jgi:hypothetical protein
MALIVDFIVTPSPSILPAAGGTTTVTFQARTDQGDGRLSADYALDPEVPYVLVGSTRLPPQPVSSIPRDYAQQLTLQSTGGSAPDLRISVTVLEEGSGQTFPRSCRVTLGS